MKRTPLRRKREMARGTKPLNRTTRLKPAGQTKRKKDARYRAYLKSPQWRAKRRACLERAGGRCECGVKAPNSIWMRCTLVATQVHHLGYARLFHELPEDLIACCRRCHETIETRDFPHRRKR